MTRPGTEPYSPGPLANTLPTRPMSQYSLTIFKEIKWGIISCPWRQAPWFFLLVAAPGPILYRRVSVFSFRRLSFFFYSSSLWQTICKYLLTKTYFSVHITHSSVNFLICRHFEKPQNKLFCGNNFFFSINQFQRIQHLHLWGKIQKKIFFFLNSSFYWMTLIDR